MPYVRDKGFAPQPKRRVAGQTFGILSFRRRLVRDYEHRAASSASRVYWAIRPSRRGAYPLETDAAGGSRLRRPSARFLAADLARRHRRLETVRLND
jgi:hypothetical protein